MTLINNPLDEKQRTIKSGTPHFTVPSEEEMREQMKTIINFNGKTFIELETKLKYEEIKRMAWELFKDNLLFHFKEHRITREEAFNVAEEFYNFAKEKEQEEQEDDNDN
jgi:hypothetical protein